MSKYFYSFLIVFLTSYQLFSQDFREEIILKGKVYKIYDFSSEDEKYDITKYQVYDDKNNAIEHIARKYDKTLNKETFLGIYRKNDTEIHFIEFNQTNEPTTLNHFVYSPNNKGKLQLIKQESNLKDFPSDLPPKFKDNKPIHPEFPGGDTKLNEWIEKNIVPVLQPELKNKDLSLTLEIDENGSANVVNTSLLNLNKKIESELLSKIKEMPKWNTIIQGYKITGVVIIPLSK